MVRIDLLGRFRRLLVAGVVTGLVNRQVPGMPRNLTTCSFTAQSGLSSVVAWVTYCFTTSASRFDNPGNLFRIWQGGMSFHGGLCGVIVALIFFAKSTNRRFFEAADFVVPLIPIALGFGRLGNFVNDELWGKPTDLPWGMLVSRLGDIPVHPSQLYQAFLEGVVLFAVVWVFSSKPRPLMSVSGLFLAGYGLFRFLIEFVRVPDQHLGYLAGDWLTMGQVLSTPMIALGGLMMFLAYRSPLLPSAQAQAQTPAQAVSPDPTGSRKRKRNKRKKKMKQYLDLVRHVRTHGTLKEDRTGNRHFECVWCPVTFRSGGWVSIGDYQACASEVDYLRVAVVSAWRDQHCLPAKPWGLNLG